MNRFVEQASTIDVAALLLPRLKEALRIVPSDTSRDDSLKGLLDISLKLIEKHTWRVLPERNIEGQFSGYSPSRINNRPMFDCARAPVFDDALISITYSGESGNQVSAVGKMDVVGEFGEAIVTEELTEDVDRNVNYPVQVTFKAGYPMDGTAWTCPSPLQQAIINMAVYIFENPSDCTSSSCNCNGITNNGANLPKSVALMVAPYVIRRYDFEV